MKTNVKMYPHNRIVRSESGTGKVLKAKQNKICQAYCKYEYKFVCREIE